MSGEKNSPGPGLPIDDEEKASKTGDTTPRETSSPSEAEGPPNALRNDDEKYHNVDEEGRDLEQVPTQASSQLPFSKARTIALVFILTGAAFLNTLSVQICVIVLPTIGAELGFQQLASNGLSPPIRSPSAASYCSGAVSQTCTASAQSLYTVAPGWPSRRSYALSFRTRLGSMSSEVCKGWARLRMCPLQ